MEWLTFFLLAVLLDRAGLNRLCPRAWLAVLLASLAPDLDRASRLISAEAYLHYAHAALHSVITAPVLLAVVAFLVHRISHNACSWPRALCLGAVGLSAHLLVAAAGVQGARLLWPLSGRWFRAGFLPDWDLLVVFVLALAWAGPWVLGLASVEMGATRPTGRAAARAALFALLCFAFGRFLLHDRALAILDSRLYDGAQPLGIAAIPSPVNPTRFTGLVESHASDRVYRDLNPLRDFDPFRAEVLQKPEPGPILEQAARSPALRAFQDFYPWTHWRAAPAPQPEGAWEVEVVDLTRPGSRPASARARFSPEGRLLGAELRL